MKMRQITMACLFLFLGFSVSAICQENKTDRTVKLTGKNHNETININIGQGEEFITIGMIGTIEGGSVELFVYAPNGEKVNNMCLRAGEGRQAKGVMEESYSDPEPGNWTIKIESENATGEIKIHVKHK